jgi:hypothetical protein
VRYLALTKLCELPAHEMEVTAVQSEIPDWGPAQAILDAQWPAGFWMSPGVGYSPKYRATVWQVVFLAAMGAPRTKAIDRACTYVLDHSRLPDGRFSAHKAATGAIACLNGNLLRAMLQLGYRDTRLNESLEAFADAVHHSGYRCRFNAASPLPRRMEDGLPCAWGAIKSLGAFAEVPEQHRSPKMQVAIEKGFSLLHDGNLATGDYPAASTPSPVWHQLGFPLGFTSDVVEALEVLGRLGAPQDPSLCETAGAVWSKRDARGRWKLEYTPGRTWGDFGKIGEANKWVTLRVLSALKSWEGISSQPSAQENP